MSNQEIQAPSEATYYKFLPIALVMMLLLGIYAAVSYCLTQDGPVQQDIINNRIETLADVHATQKKLTTSYAVINQEEATYRIPVKDAMKLTLQELQSSN